ncbi:ferredoxin [Xanthobacter autotrophicus]|uniref:ferredoxin n=1 Tax=Xanthobacter autotrophicus TaxID=280 RepID=UPI00372B7F96
MKKIVVDHSKCEGIGICESILPNTFEVQDDSTLKVNEEIIRDARSLRLSEDAVASCPKGALSIVDSD